MNPVPSDSAPSAFAPPDLLIFFHMPKTGGSTMDFILEHCFPGHEHFNANVGVPSSALSTSDRGKIADKFARLTTEHKRSMRCVTGAHLPMGIHMLFGRPAKYFTIVRHPVDRAVSQFYFMRTHSYVPIYDQIKDMTIDQYLDSRIGLDPFNHQVRMLSGCAELDGPWGIDGRPVPAAPVEERHLEMAKRNIADQFLAAAPLEEFTSLVVLLKELYRWPLRHCLFEIRNVTDDRPRLEALSSAIRDRLEACNRYDMALYDWVKARFSRQAMMLGPKFPARRRQFASINDNAQRIGRLMPRGLRKTVANLLLSS